MTAFQEALAEARARRDALRAELNELDQYIALHTKLFGDRNEGEPTPNVIPSTSRHRSVTIRKRNDPREICRLSEQAIQEQRRPMQRGDLVEWIEARGVEIHSEDKPRYIGTILWRNGDRFENIEGKGYWLKGTPLPDTFDSLIGMRGDA